MNSIPAHSGFGWGDSIAASGHTRRARLRDVLPPIAAALLIALGHLAFGAVQPIATLVLSAGLTVVAVLAVLAAGPRHVTAGMLAGATLLALVTVTGLAGPSFRAGPHLAGLFAAGAAWTVGYIAARHRHALDAAWSALLWSSIAYCSWMFFNDVATASNQGRAIVDAFETPANASLLFGLFSVIAMGRVLYIVKMMDAESLSRSAMVERLLKDGLSGLLLLAISIACLAMAGSYPGIIMAGAVLVGYIWWDTLAITLRPHRGLLLRLAAFVLPLAALGLAAWGGALAWLRDETITPGIGQASVLPNLQRLDAYMSAWAQQPVLGHGLGTIGIVGAQEQTLLNAKAMQAPGDAHNVFLTWLVETGAAGLALLVIALGAMHARVLSALASRRTSRTFPRLAIATGFLMLLHGVTDSSLDLPSATWLYALILGGACGVATSGRQGHRDDAAAKGG